MFSVPLKWVHNSKELPTNLFKPIVKFHRCQSHENCHITVISSDSVFRLSCSHLTVSSVVSTTFTVLLSILDDTHRKRVSVHLAKWDWQHLFAICLDNEFSKTEKLYWHFKFLALSLQVATWLLCYCRERRHPDTRLMALKNSLRMVSVRETRTRAAFPVLISKSAITATKPTGMGWIDECACGRVTDWSYNCKKTSHY